MSTASLAQPQNMDESAASIKAKLRRSQRLQKLKAMLLIAPLFLFTLLIFIVPVGMMLVKSVDNPELREVWPKTSEAVLAWHGELVPDAEMFYLLSQEIRTTKKNKTVAKAAKRLNQEFSGMRSLVNKTARKLVKLELLSPAEEKAQMISLDKRWGLLETWRSVRRAAPEYTSLYLLAATDHTLDKEGKVIAASEHKSIYIDILIRTLWIAFVVTMVCLVLGYPLAYLLANASSKWSGWLMIALLLPFWTSLLVRTSAWMVLLQKNGVINNLLIKIGVINEPLTLLYEREAVYIAMTNLLLPFMVLSLYSVMKSISPVYMRAALSLGAHPVLAFIRVYIPQTLPGVAAGWLLCFILALGYYITPALVGGADDQMLSYFVAYYTNQAINWGMASALGGVLLLISSLLFVVYVRLTNANKAQQG